MGMRLIKHRIIGTKVMKKLHHTLHIAAFLTTRIELAIRERTRTTFAKTIIRLGIQALIAVEKGNILLAVSDRFASFENNRFYAMFNERESRKQARRACTNNSCAMLGVVHILEDRRLIKRDRCILRQRATLLVGKHSQVDLELLLASINRTLHDTETLFHVVSFLRG